MSTKKRYVILTPYPEALILAGVAALHELEATILATPNGAVLVRDLPAPEYTDWDISELLGGGDEAVSAGAKEGEASTASVSDDPIAVAKIFSRLSAYGVVLFQAELGDGVGGEEGVSGLVRAQRVVRGELGEEIPAGLIINTLDDELEALVLGSKPLEEIDPQLIRPEDYPQAVQALQARMAGGENQ